LVEHVGLALGARARVSLPPRLHKSGKERPLPSVNPGRQMSERGSLAAHQVVVRRVSDQLEYAVPDLVQVGDVAFGDDRAAVFGMSFPQFGKLGERARSAAVAWAGVRVGQLCQPPVVPCGVAGEQVTWL